jgi:hypothetical protein
VLDLAEGLGLGVNRVAPAYTLVVTLPGGSALLDAPTPVARAVELNEQLLVCRLGRPRRRRGKDDGDEDE